MNKDKGIVVKVLLTREYFIPMVDEDTCALNGEKKDDILNQYFKEIPAYQYHATRDRVCQVGCSEEFIKYEVLRKINL